MDVVPSKSKSILVVVTGLQGTGKSTVADAAATYLDGLVLSHDWAMSGLRPFPEIQAALGAMDPAGFQVVGWSILAALTRSQLRRGKSVVLDGMARATQIDQLRGLAGEEGARFVVIMTECSDVELHESLVQGRDRGIPNWYELAWDQVEGSRANWDPELHVDLRLDAADPLPLNEARVRAHLEGVDR